MVITKILINLYLYTCYTCISIKPGVVSFVEDLSLRVSRCLSQFGVYPVNTKGTDLRQRFNSDNPMTLFNGHPIHKKYFYYKWNGDEFGNPAVRSQLFHSSTHTIYFCLPLRQYDSFLCNKLDGEHSVECVTHASHWIACLLVVFHRFHLRLYRLLVNFFTCSVLFLLSCPVCLFISLFSFVFFLQSRW